MEKEYKEREQLPQILLERFYLHELSENEELKVKQFIKEHPNENKRLKEIADSNKDFFESYSDFDQLASIKQKYQLKKLEENVSQIPLRKLKKHKLIVSSTLLAALLFIAVLSPSLKKIFFDNNMKYPSVRVKGGEPQLFLYRKKNAEIERLFPEETAKNRDLLQISFNPVGSLYHVILSIDGRKQITLHYPAKDKEEAPLIKKSKKQQHFLSYSYELDDAPKFERFILISSKKAFKVKKVLNAVEELIKSGENIEKSQLKLPNTLKQYSLVIKKRNF